MIQWLDFSYYNLSLTSKKETNKKRYLLIEPMGIGTEAEATLAETDSLKKELSALGFFKNGDSFGIFPTPKTVKSLSLLPNVKKVKINKNKVGFYDTLKPNNQSNDDKGEQNDTNTTNSGSSGSDGGDHHNRVRNDGGETHEGTLSSAVSSPKEEGAERDKSEDIRNTGTRERPDGRIDTQDEGSLDGDRDNNQENDFTGSLGDNGNKSSGGDRDSSGNLSRSSTSIKHVDNDFKGGTDEDDEFSSTSSSSVLNKNHFYAPTREKEFGTFNKKEKYNANLAVIQLLTQLNKEQRNCTPEEKKLLSLYSGWGGLSSSLEASNDEIHHLLAEHDQSLHFKPELKTSFFSALDSVTTSFFTHPELVNSIWSSILASNNFPDDEPIKILEPSMGTGNFLSLMPDELVKKSKITGIEKDLITSEVASNLFPDAKIFNKGFEEVYFPDNYFDVIVTNVPFGDFKVIDSHDDNFSSKEKLLIHDYFIIKSLKKLKQNGIGVFITSSGTLDKKDSTARKKMNEYGTLVQAIRLPNKTHQSEAGTEVLTDILFFVGKEKKLNQEEDLFFNDSLDLPAWIDSAPIIDNEFLEHPISEDPKRNENEVFINDFFRSNDGHILGDLSLKSNRFGKQEIAVSNDLIHLPAQLNRLIDLPEFKQPLDSLIEVNRIQKSDLFNQLVGTVLYAEPKASEKAEPKASKKTVPKKKAKVSFEPKVLTEIQKHKLFSNITEGIIGVNSFALIVDESGFEEPEVISSVATEWNEKTQDLDYTVYSKKLDLSKNILNKIEHWILLRDALFEVTETQLNNDPINKREEARTLLSKRYDDFEKKFGHLNKPSTRRLFADSPEAGRLFALEKYNKEKKIAKKSDIFFEDVISPPKNIESADSILEGFNISLAKQGYVDIEHIAALTGETEKNVIESLVNDDLIYDHGGWIIKARYLSGNVKKKYHEAVKLKEELKTDIYDKNIRDLKAVFPEDVPLNEISLRLSSYWLPSEVIRDFLSDTFGVGYDMAIEYNKSLSSWVIDLSDIHLIFPIENAKNIASNPKDLQKLLNIVANDRSTDVYKTIENSDGKKTRVLQPEESAAREEKAENIKELFYDYIQNPELREKLMRLYNDTQNVMVAPEYDGEHLTFPGMAINVNLRKHQKDSAWRAINEGNLLLAHEVGTGKTFEMIAISQELKRIGKCNKPVILVKNNMIEQIERDARQLYPNAKILVTSRNDLKKENRKLFVSKVANNNWDLVIMSHTQFKKIEVDDEFMISFLEEESSKLRSSLIVDNLNMSTKLLSAKIKSHEKKLATLMKNMGDIDNTGVSFKTTGIDYIIVDEAHNFKNLGNTSTKAGLAVKGSQQAMDLFIKTRQLYEIRGDVSGVVFATGTPISNNIVEIYALQKYLQPDVLEDLECENIDTFASQYFGVKSSYEPDPSGTGFRKRSRYILQNIPELMTSLRNVMDVVETKDIEEIILPDAETHNLVAELSEEQGYILDELAARVEEIRYGNVTPKEDNILNIITEGRKMSLDPRLIDPDLPDNPFSKVNMAIDEMAKIYHETAADRLTQLVFCDLGTPGNDKDFSVYDDTREKLIEKGVNPDEIEFMQDANTDEKKEALFERTRSGETRILMGSTPTMGEGTNVQDKLIALYHLDPPWRPSDIEQRLGRILRFGNMNKNIKEFICTTNGSFDLFMWCILKNKAEAFSKILSGEIMDREFDSEINPSYAETAAITAGNPLIKDKLEIDQKISKLKSLKSSYEKSMTFDTHKIKTKKIMMGERKDDLEQLMIVTTPQKEIDTLTANKKAWHLDLREYGFEADFDGKREDMLKILKKLMTTQEIKEISTGLSCFGIPVTVSRPDPKEPALWTISNNEDEKTYPYSNMIETFISKAPGKINFLKKKIEEDESFIKTTMEYIASNKFDKEDELKEAIEMGKEIDRKIERLDEIENHNTAIEIETNAPSMKIS